MSRTAKLRFTVRPCDNGEDFRVMNGRARQRSWEVVDRVSGECVGDYDTRREAYAEAKTRNAEPLTREPTADSGLCPWQTAYGLPGSRYCGKRLREGHALCAEHERDERELYPNTVSP